MIRWPMVFRQILRRPGFALASIALLAAGIAANTTVFSLVSAIFLRPLPYPHSGSLVFVYEANRSKQERTSLLAPVRLEEWNRLNQTFAGLAGYYSDTKTDRTQITPERLHALCVSKRYFDVYGVTPEAGRTFDSAEESVSGPKAVVLSDALWTRRYHRSSSTLGSRIRLGDEAYTVIGVMPRTFVSTDVDIWLAAPLYPYLTQVRDARFYGGVGRLKEGVSIEQARDDLDRVQSRLGETFPQSDKGWSAEVSGMKESIVGSHGRFLWLALGAAATLMLLTCANIAGLLLGHMHQRRTELAIRTSLGASRFQLMATILGEIGMLIVAGIGAGVLASEWTIAAAIKLFSTLPRISELEFDWRSLLFIALLGALTFLLVGIAPALEATRSSLSSQASHGGRTETGNRHGVHQVLLLVQLSITVVLLVTGGLLLRSYQRLAAAPVGFSTDHVLTFHVGAEWSEDRIAIGRVQKDLIAALQNTPGVTSAGMTNFLPTDEATLRYQYQIDGLTGASRDRAFAAGARTVSGGYVTALQIPLLEGTNCPVSPIDLNRPPKALVNSAFAKGFGGGQDLIGRRLHVLGTDLSAPYEITGVVADVREDSPRRAATPYVYTCSMAGGWPDPEYVIRTKEDPEAFAGTLRKLVATVAPGRALFAVSTLQDHAARSLAQPRLTAQMLTGFAIAALLLAACGLYSLCTLMVTARTREIGTRIALGARGMQVVTGVLSRATATIMAGLLVGGLSAMAAGTLIRSLLFNVAFFDPLTLIGVCALLAAVCFLAMLPPAIRAVSIDPVKAMREQ